MLGQIESGMRVVEVGCGTGWGVTLPLLRAGVDVAGVDLDEPSITAGQGIFSEHDAPPAALRAVDLRDLDGRYDAVIASELLEHLGDRELREMLETIRVKLNPGGLLLVTTPNGYGWFELDAAVWRWARLDLLIERTRLAPALRRLKQLVVSGATTSPVPNTLSSSPHVRRFTLSGLSRWLTAAGFEVTDARGSVMCCGPLTELLCGGSRRVERANARLGRRFPRVSSGFYVAARAGDSAMPIT
ncbi:MAG: class I SAM-dependent methyltransferase [Solirubrobacterales bacterium]|nr:class I SAM-dependent methyltransferase [Solirubrobacterales bacterium]